MKRSSTIRIDTDVRKAIDEERKKIGKLLSDGDVVKMMIKKSKGVR